MRYSDWFIDPSYSRCETIYRNGFAMCLVPADNGTWTAQAYDELAETSRAVPLFETSPFDSLDEARHAAEQKIFELSR